MFKSFSIMREFSRKHLSKFPCIEQSSFKLFEYFLPACKNKLAELLSQFAFVNIYKSQLFSTTIQQLSLHRAHRQFTAILARIYSKRESLLVISLFVFTTVLQHFTNIKKKTQHSFRHLMRVLFLKQYLRMD